MVDDMKRCPQSLTSCCARSELGKGCDPLTYRISWGSCEKAACLVSIWNVISPRDHMSAANGFMDIESLPVDWVKESPKSCSRSSGAMNCGVPFTVDGESRLCSIIRFEMPKSVILIHQGSGGWDLIRMF